MVTDLFLFHKIVYGNICIGLPSYLTLVTASSRPAYLDKLRKRTPKCICEVHPVFECSLKEIDQDIYDPLLFKCSFKPRTKVNDSTFFIRSYLEWNKIPLLIRIEENAEIFQEKLKNYIWELLKEKIGRSKWPD